MKKILRPFGGLDDIAFGMPMSEVKTLVGIAESTVRNRHLDQVVVSSDDTTYVFEKGVLVAIELKYQKDVELNGIDVFETVDLEALWRGHEVESRRKHFHVKGLGLILMSFGLKNRKKREVWYYSKEMVTEYETFLDVV
jgi:hypothetical protein